MARATEIATRFPWLRERLEAAAATDDARSTREQLVSFGVQAVPDGFEPRLAAG